MIDVPVLVKDALRDGRLKKNYRFVLGEEEWHEVGSFETIGWYTPSTNYGDDMKYTIRDSKTYRFIVDDADHDTYALYIYKGSDRNWRTVEATSRNTWDITLTDAFYAYVEIKSSSGNYFSPVSVQNFFAYTIDNNNLVSESVSIDERMCSGDTLKFGLCEGSSLEFQYFDFPNITGQRIQAFVDVESEEMEYSKIRVLTRSLYSLPADGRYKITATAENMANILALFFVHGNTTTRMEFTVAQDGHGEIEIPNAKKNDDIYLSYRSGTTPTAEVFQWVHKWHTIPLGFFDVKKCSRQASTGIIKATAYNKLQSEYLDAKANELIMEQFNNPEIEVFAVDILQLLLKDYGIKAIDAEKDWLDRQSEPSYIFRVSRSTYNIVNSGITSGAYYIYVDSFTGAAVLDPSQVYQIGYTYDGDYDVEALELQYYNWIHDTMTRYLSNGEVGANALMDELKRPYNSSYSNYLGWHDFFGFELTKQDNTKEYYSLIAWQERLPNVNGSVKDLFKRSFTGCTRIVIRIPYALRFQKNSSETGPSSVRFIDGVYDSLTQEYLSWKFPYTNIGIDSEVAWRLFSVARILNYTPAEELTLVPSELPDITLRQLQSAVFETQCQFGQLSRITDLFSGVELNHSRLYPADDLYPSEGLYPDGAQESGFRSQYSQLWADEGNIHKWRYLIITYKGLDGDGNETDLTLQRTINNDGTDNYNMSDNWLFRNLIWTAEQVGEYADAMVLKMRDITWFPFEMWCAGLPYLETGDEIEIPLGEETYTSYILQRQLKGIQNLQDTYINGTLDIF